MAGDPRPLSGAFEGWTQFGGGSRYFVKDPTERIVLRYDINGLGYYGPYGRANVSERPWSVRIDGKQLENTAGKPRVFGSKESARAAAEKVIKEETVR